MKVLKKINKFYKYILIILIFLILITTAGLFGKAVLPFVLILGLIIGIMYYNYLENNEFNDFKKDVETICKNEQIGNYQYNIDTEKYSDEYRELLALIIESSQNSKSVYENFCNAIDAYSRGKRNVQIQEYSGEKYLINESINRLGKNLDHVRNEITSLVSIVNSFQNEKLISYEPVEGDFASIFNDLKEVTIWMQKRIHWYSSILDSIPFPVSVTDINMNWTFINRAVEDLIKVKRDDAIGKPCSQWGANICNTQNCGINCLNCGKKTTFFTQNEKDFKVDVAHLYDENGSRVGHIEVVQDISQITKQQKIENELMQRIADKEKESNKMKGTFLANMSHEIRTPMNAIIGLTEIQLQKDSSKDAHDTLEKVNKSAKILLAIVNDILDFSKMEAHKLDIVNEVFELENTISEALMMISPRMAEKDVDVLLKLDYNLPNSIYGDKTRLWQILKNVLDNSAKFTDKGSILLDIFLLNQENGIAQICFNIKDTGLGMTSEQLDRLSIPFEQFHLNSEKLSGTGLGMAITKELVGLMGGTISITSELNIGTETTIIIPFEVIGERRIVSKTEELNGRVMLVLNDDIVMNELIEKLLLEIGIEYVIEKNVEDALQKLTEYKKEGKYFDITMIYYTMEEQEMVHTINELKKTSPKTINLMVASAYNRKSFNMDAMKQAGISEFLDKTLIPSEFISKLYHIFGIRSEQKKITDLIQFNGAKVILCEDNFINQEVAIGMLSMFGIVPVVANNGQEALELLEKEYFDILLLDMSMPVLDGHETTAIIRGSIGKSYQNIPIVAMTANAMKDEVERCLSEGMNGHVAKPTSIEVLHEQLIKWLPKELQKSSIIQ